MKSIKFKEITRRELIQQFAALDELRNIFIMGGIGSGKSYHLINHIIPQLIKKENKGKIKIIPIDYKGTELNFLRKNEYKSFLPYGYITDLNRDNVIIDLFRECFFTRWSLYVNKNKTELEKMPYLYFIIDEFYELCNDEEVEKIINQIIGISSKIKVRFIITSQISMNLTNQTITVESERKALINFFDTRISLSITEADEKAIFKEYKGKVNLKIID